VEAAAPSGFLEDLIMNVNLSVREKQAGSKRLSVAGMVRPGAVSSPVPWSQSAASDEHLAMIHTYQRAGGLVTCDEAATLLGRHRDQPISQLARWIVARNVVSFVWQSETMVPLFQFEISDMSLRHGTSQVIAELAGAFDDLELATWFAQPNCWLGNVAPLAVVDTDQFAVLQAARVDRYLARG
jgi:hypothetical protein